MRFLSAPSLLSTAAVCVLSAGCVAAHADAPVQFTFLSDQTAVFSLDPSTYETQYFGYDFPAISGTLDGVPDTFNVGFYPSINSSTPGESLYLSDGNDFLENTFLNPNGTDVPFTGDPATVTPGTFSGFIQCSASLRMPASGLPPTLAFFQFPGFGNCGDAVSLVVGSPSATPTPTPGVTPEPSTLALFGTGALGMVGAIRRRRQQA